jgi:GNAT superfamily N-acetyltransferase
MGALQLSEPNPRLVLEPDPKSADVGFLEEQIYQHIVQQTGRDDGTYFAVLLRGENDELMGGAYGWTFLGTCYIRYLFVPADLRGKGYGARLMQAVEKEAAARECIQILLHTYEFQAPAFYRKLGFTAVSTVDDFLPGHRRFTMLKRLP